MEVRKQEPNTSLFGRRQVLSAALGVGGLAVAGSARAAEAQDLRAPPGLAPLAMLDQRFPVTYQDSVPRAVEVITNYFAALSRRDLKALAACFHFPFASYEGVDPVVVSTVEEFMVRQPASLSVSMDPERWGPVDGYMKPGSYDVFGSLEVVTTDPVNVGIALTYFRYGSDGKRILRSEGIYAVTNNDGRWAIQLMSTIMTPADMMHVTFEDTIDAAKRVRINHDLAFQYHDKGYDVGTWQKGRVASVRNEVVQVFFQRISNIEPYRVKGVKSRLEVSENTARGEMDEAYFRRYYAQFQKLGVGRFGFVFGAVPEERIIHAAAEKAHVLSGAARYTAAGEEVNYNHHLYVQTLKPATGWGIAGTFSYVSPHDRANDLGAGAAPR